MTPAAPRSAGTRETPSETNRALPNVRDPRSATSRCDGDPATRTTEGEAEAKIPFRRETARVPQKCFSSPMPDVMHSEIGLEGRRSLRARGASWQVVVPRHCAGPTLEEREASTWRPHPRPSRHPWSARWRLARLARRARARLVAPSRVVSSRSHRHVLLLGRDDGRVGVSRAGALRRLRPPRGSPRGHREDAFPGRGRGHRRAHLGPPDRGRVLPPAPAERHPGLLRQSPPRGARACSRAIATPAPCTVGSSRVDGRTWSTIGWRRRDLTSSNPGRDPHVGGAPRGVDEMITLFNVTGPLILRRGG